MRFLSCCLPALLCFFLWSRAEAQVPVIYSTSIYYTPVDFGAMMMVFRLEGIEGNFIFNTGLSRMTLSDEIAKRLKLDIKPAIGGNGKPIIEDGVQAKMVTVQHGQLNTFPLTQIRALVVKSDKMLAFYEQPVDGIIGANLASAFATLIDFQRHTLTFYYGAPLTVEDLKNADMDNAIALPLVTPTKNYDGDLLVAVRVRFNDAEEEDLVIDTGAADTMVSSELAAKLKLRSSAQGSKDFILGKSVKVNKAKVSTLKFGNNTLNNLTVKYPQDVKEKNYCPHLGLDVLTKFRVLLDIPGKKLYIKPIDAPKSIQ